MNIEIERRLIRLNVDYAIMFISDDDIAVKCEQSDSDITFLSQFVFLDFK